MIPAEFSSETRQIVERLNRCEINQIMVYQGDEDKKPIYYEEIDLFKKMLEKIGVAWKVLELSDHELHPEHWNPKTTIVMIPGAKSSDLDVHIGHQVSAIRDFVHKGGNFLGWCGGAYWACHRVSYRLSETVELKRVRELNLWKGEEKGPLLPYKGLPTATIEFFHGTVPIKWKGVDTVHPVLLSGGGSFIPAEDEHPYEVLATYQDQPEGLSRGVVKTYPGKGIAILANTYFTYNTKYLGTLEVYEKNFPQHNWKKIFADLDSTSSFRELCFAKMLEEFTQRTPPKTF